MKNPNTGPKPAPQPEATHAVPEQHVAAATPEQDFATAFKELQQTIEQNANFEEAGVDEYEGMSVYANIIKATSGESARELREYETTLLEHMRTEVQFNTAQAHINMDALDAPIDGVDDPRSARVQTIITDLEGKIAATNSTAERDRLQYKLAAMRGYLDDVVQADEDEDIQAAVQTYAIAAETTHELGDAASAASHEALQHTQEELEAEGYKNTLSAAAYEVIAEYPEFQQQAEVAEEPVVEVPEAPEVAEQPANPEVVALQEKLADLRGQLATVNARREKSAGNREYDTAKDIRAAYNQAARELFKLEHREMLEDPAIDNATKLRKMSEFTVSAGTDLEMQTAQNAAKNHSRLGKMIDWYGRRGKVSKLIIGIGASALAGVVTGGAGTAVVSGALFTANLEAKRRQKRIDGELAPDALTADQIASSYLKDATWTGENATPMAGDELDRAMDSMLARTHGKTEQFIRDEQSRRRKRILGGAAFGATVGLVSQNLVPHMDGMFGGETAQAVTPDVAETVAAPVVGPEFGLSNVYVNPGDGFYNVFESMNIPESEWSSVLDAIGPDLIQSGDAYAMADGTPGIAAPGQLSQQAFEAIMRARG